MYNKFPSNKGVVKAAAQRAVNASGFGKVNTAYPGQNAGMTLDSDADCESGTIVTKVVKTDKGRDLPVRVCEENRG